MRLAICPIERCRKCGSSMRMASVRYGFDNEVTSGVEFLSWTCVRCGWTHSTDTLDAESEFLGRPAIEEREGVW